MSRRVRIVSALTDLRAAVQAWMSTSRVPCWLPTQLLGEAPVPLAGRSMEQMQLFDELIWSNPEICNSCFARIRQVTELNPDESVSKYAPTEDRRRTQDALRGHDEESHDRYGERRTWRSVTFCRQCGSKNGLASDETLSKSEAVECIIEIAGRLEEMGYDVNLAPMRQLVKRGKSRETLRNHDRELLAYATAHGVQPNAD